MLMCLAHWRDVPPLTQKAIWREYRKGQERDKRPSVRYLAVQQLAIAQCAFKPNDFHAAKIAAGYIAKAQHYRQLAVERGEGDPLQGLVPA